MSASPRIPDRVRNRECSTAMIADILSAARCERLGRALEAEGVPSARDQHRSDGLRGAASPASRDAASSAAPARRHRAAGRQPDAVQGSPLTFDRPPPLLGEHTDEILRELGLEDAEAAADQPLTILELIVPRIPLPTPDAMTPEQRQVYDSIVKGPRGTLVGPLRAALHSPELADKWQQLGELLRYRTSLPPEISEIAVPGHGRHWNAQVEWYMHAIAAAKAGVAADVIEDIKERRRPVNAGTRRSQSTTSRSSSSQPAPPRRQPTTRCFAIGTRSASSSLRP